MKNQLKIVTLILFISLPLSAEVKLTNSNATMETKALYRNLSLLEQDVLFGHQDSLAYGTRWWGSRKKDLNSDIKAVTGSFPAVFGLDVGGIGLGAKKNLDGVAFDDYQYYIKQIFLMGGVNTISWHMYSPIDRKNSWNKKSYVKQLVPGGKYHERLIMYLNAFIKFNEQLRIEVNEKQVWIPIIFRPWHEHNGDWFWWGKGHTSEQDFISLWQFTVNYLNQRGQNNLIYAFSPDRSRLDINNFEESYLYAYPGDNYVDIIGYDNYWDLGHPANKQPIAKQQGQFIAGLEQLTDLAANKNKVSALSEGGQEGVKEDRFWTQRFAAGIFANTKTSRIAYALVWRNNNNLNGKKEHYYGVYPGQKNQDDFIAFHSHLNSLFIQDLPSLYK